jgi:hypothetical protein
VFLAAGNAWAIPTIGFADVDSHGGTLSWIPSSDGAVGTDIILDTIYANDVPVNSGVNLNIVDGRLNFSTETNVFSIIGSLPALGITTPQVLLEGNLGSPWGWEIQPITEVDTYSHFVGFGIDAKNPTLEAFYGFAGQEWTFTTRVSAFGYIEESPLEVFQASVVNNPVPEPTTMLLFGAGLVGLAGFGRKKFKK